MAAQLKAVVLLSAVGGFLQRRVFSRLQVQAVELI
jgi:hypothetical protein